MVISRWFTMVESQKITLNKHKFLSLKLDSMLRKGINRCGKTMNCIILSNCLFFRNQKIRVAASIISIKVPKKEETEYTLHGELETWWFQPIWKILVKLDHFQYHPFESHHLRWIAPHQVVASFNSLCCLKSHPPPNHTPVFRHLDVTLEVRIHGSFNLYLQMGYIGVK